MSLAIDTTSTFIKIIQKSAEKDISTKLEAIFSLAKALNGIGKGLNEVTFKEAFKAIKLLLSDKHVMVKEAAAQVGFRWTFPRLMNSFSSACKLCSRTAQSRSLLQTLNRW